MGFNWLEIALGVGLLALFLFELGDRQFRQSWYRDGRRVKRNIGFGLASVIAMVVLKRTNATVEQFSVVKLMDWENTGVVAIPACFLLAELVGWLLHYVKHRNGFLWKFHFQHHLENEYNIWLTAHTHALEVVISGAIMALVLSFWGFSVLTIEIYLVYYGFMKVLQHSAHHYSFGVLDKVFVTPAYHRLHHEVNSGCNYGITLTLFDRLFRTARWPVNGTMAHYGIGADEPMPFGFWKEMTFFLGGVLEKRPSGSARAHSAVSLRGEVQPK